VCILHKLINNHVQYQAPGGRIFLGKGRHGLVALEMGKLRHAPVCVWHQSCFHGGLV
jgi:hypothetical protein